MTTDSPRAVLGDAWGRIPHTRETNEGYGTFTRIRIERIVVLIVGFGCLALGTQAFVAGLGGPQGMTPAWHGALMTLAFVPLVTMIVMCGIGRLVKLFAGAFAIAYLVVLLLWPVATAGGGVASAEGEPWIFFLVNVATVSAVLAFRLRLQIAWAIATPLMFGIVRVIDGGFAPALWYSVTLDVSFTLILAGMLVTLPWVFRAIAVGVDEVRTRAVASYAAAAAADATEQERVAVAALMHDSVLAALIAAERAQSPRERALAVGMAREALTRLANTDSTDEQGSDAPVAVETIAAGLERFAADLGVDLAVARTQLDNAPPIPGRIARALQLAASQAIANAVQHAGGHGLEVAVASGQEGVAVEVGDRGAGFDLATIPPDRLGIRGSIVARMAAVGGRSRIESDAAGTLVTLTWMGGED